MALTVVAAHQTIDVELHVKAPLFLIGKQGAIHGLLNAHQPWPNGVRGKVNGLMFDVGKGTAAQIADQVRRHTEDATDFLHLKLARFKELRLVVGQTDGREGHILFQNSDL